MRHLCSVCSVHICVVPSPLADEAFSDNSFLRVDHSGFGARRNLSVCHRATGAADCYYLMSLMIFGLFGMTFSLLPEECASDASECPHTASTPTIANSMSDGTERESHTSS